MVDSMVAVFRKEADKWLQRCYEMELQRDKLVKALNEIAFMDEHMSADTARAMMNIARETIASLKKPSND